MHDLRFWMNSKIHRAGALMLAFFASACGSSSEEERLVDSASTLSELISDRAFRGELIERLSQKATGDYEVLLADLADVTLADGRRVGDALDATGILSDGRPYHIAAPLGIEGLRDAEAPRVTYVPDRPEEELDVLSYFAAGQLVETRAASEPPTEPVFVIALNERVNTGAEDVESHSAPLMSDAAGPRKEITLKTITIFNDHEPWSKGKPEIFMACAFPNGSSAKIYLSDVDEERIVYWPMKPLVNYYLSYGNPMVCSVFEEDGGTYGPFTISYSGVSFTFQIHDKDESLGHTPVNFYDENDKAYSTGDAEFTLSW